MRTKCIALAAAVVLIGYQGLAQTPPSGNVTPPSADPPAGDEAREPVLVIPQSPPLTKLEALERKPGVLLLTSFNVVGTVQAESGTIEVSAVQITDMGSKEVARGAAIRVTSRTGLVASTYIDEDELAPLLDALTALPKLSREDSPLGDFTARYATHGNLEIANVELSGARYAIVRAMHIAPVTGEVTRSATRLRIARLGDLRQQIAAAKEQLAKAR